MNVSKPASVSFFALPGIGHAQADSASTASAVCAAAAPGSIEIHRIALHALSASGAAAVSVTGAAAPAFVAIPDNDTLGIIAAYLPQDDQLLMRKIAPVVGAVVDPTIHTLKLSARQACTLLSQANHLTKLRELHLTEFNDKDLIDLAAILTSMPKTDFELILKLNMFQSRRTPAPVSAPVSADGLRALAAVRLSGLTLKDIPISIEMGRALALSMSPLSISLAYDHTGKGYEVSQIPMLRSLQVHSLTSLTTKAIDALRSHETLAKCEIRIISGDDLAILATSVHIRSLKIGFIGRGGEAAALRALADNRVLTSLDVRVDEANALAVLSHNATLQKLRINVRQLAPSSLASIATMPALKEFVLSGHAGLKEPIGVDDIAALCVKQLNALSFCDIQMDGATRSLLATAQTAMLRLESCTPFESEDFAALNRNQSIKSLFIWNAGRSTRYEDVLSIVASGPPQLEWLNITINDRQGVVQTIEAAWLASGRRLENLHLVLNRN